MSASTKTFLEILLLLASLLSVVSSGAFWFFGKITWLEIKNFKDSIKSDQQDFADELREANNRHRQENARKMQQKFDRFLISLGGLTLRVDEQENFLEKKEGFKVRKKIQDHFLPPDTDFK